MKRMDAALEEHLRLIDGLRAGLDTVRAISNAIIHVLEADGRIYLLGNGGSAADAQHIAAEFVGRFRLDRRALPAIALTTDTSALLSIGNDYGFDRVFARQVEALVAPGDILWALSTSGNSANIVEAVRAAREIGAIVVGFTGRSGGKLKPLCDLCLTVDHDSTDRIQEIHQIAYHFICEAVERYFAE